MAALRQALLLSRRAGPAVPIRGGAGVGSRAAILRGGFERTLQECHFILTDYIVMISLRLSKPEESNRDQTT